MSALTLFLFVFALVKAKIHAEITVLEDPPTIYNRHATIKIKGAGFDAKAPDINLEISATGQSSLLNGKDFTIKIVDDGIVLTLLSGRR